ncbi:uncharacterized protein LOC130977073 [Arachis stenosperma]|uniref:uncharacterized protein LOC130977073 n=1 Tax=Arachis stenosperma TaxID=217475 RepID=UPI0025AC7526|nr:uncharacterized protein LOC130977073 [Arachis stenosperma]
MTQLEELQKICGSNTKPAMGNDHSSCRTQGAALQNQIDRLQRLVNERSQQINTLESMLGNVRQQLALSNDKVRQLEAELSKAKLTAANGTKKVEELEQETRRLRRELESEKANGKQLSDQLLSTATLLLGLQAEIRQLSNDAVTREKELQEATKKLQELDRENCLLVETLRSKLDGTKQMLDASNDKVRQLETQIHEEKLTIENGMKKIEELEDEARILREELESEKAVREEVWNKASVLELEKGETMRDLDSERQRLRGVKERLMLHKTQLQALDSTTELIQMLFTNQLKTMQSTLEDKENFESTFVDTDGEISCKEKEVDNVGAEAMVEGNGRGTEQGLEIECRASHDKENIDLEKISSQDCDNRQFDDEIEYAQTPDYEALPHLPSYSIEKIVEDSECGRKIRTADLLFSQGCGCALNDSNVLEIESQRNPSSVAAGGGNERQVLLLLN